MRNGMWRAWPLAAYIAVFAGVLGSQEPDQSRLDRFSEKVRQDLTGIPNYTCLETIERASRDPKARTFKPVDTIRLEVSSVAGKEMFAWPGSRRFSDEDVSAMVTNGTIGTGMFSMFAPHLFTTPNSAWQYRGEENLDGHTAVRYDYHLAAAQTGMHITTSGASETVAAKGSFWFDPVSLDLLRVEVYGDHMPDDLHLEESVFWTNYARMHIGATDALLPKRSELTMTHFSGASSRNAMDFSNCREYQSESTIRFDAPSPDVQEAPKPQVREVDLPDGLLVQVELDSAIDSKSAVVGDALRGRVAREVLYNGKLLVPSGATVTGHLCKLERSAARSAVGIQLSEIEWEGARAAFHGELFDLDRKSAGAHRPITYFDGHKDAAMIDKSIPDAGVFFIDGARFRIAPGFHMVWRTAAHAAERRRNELY